VLLVATLLAVAGDPSLASPPPRTPPHTAPDGPPPYRADLRIGYIARALSAVADTSAGQLQQSLDYVRMLAHGACSAGAQRLRVECLIVAVQRHCHDLAGADATRCPLYMDVLVSNVLADERLIPIDRRYHIVQTNVDYRAALAAELRRVEGRLAVDFRLATGDARDPSGLAPNIDRYCLATADDTTFSYQTCVSSLVWFIEGPQGGERR
jgi:hypothetical protein